MNWHILPFSELSARQLYGILQLRSEIFVVEQKCAYQDVDGYDLNAIHVMAHDGKILAGYARILPAGKYPQISIGRVAVHPSRRGQGLAREIVQRSLDYIQESFPPQPILAQSQQYLEKFYASFGFRVAGEPYDEDGILHIDMLNSF